MAKGVDPGDGPLPPLWRTYHIMKAFPGMTTDAIDDTPAETWDELLAIDAAWRRGSQS